MSEPTPPTNVLVVDDTIENVRLLANMLGEQGLEVRPVTSGRQALLAVERDPPDLILLDITMPEMDGYEVCARLKERPELRDVPVIFLSAMTDLAGKVRAFEVGGVDYITKPFQVEEVLARVRAHVALRQARLELSRSYAQLRALEQLRDDLVHMVVHDMRSPLMVMQGMLELVEVEAGRTLGQQPARYLDQARQATRVLAGMTNDLLDLSRLEAGQMPLARSRCDLARIAREARDAVAAWERGRTIDLDVAGPIDVDCDGGLLRRVLENLIGNGAKHTPPGGGLRVTISPAAGRVRVAVQDDGPGVAPEVRARLFEKFAAAAASPGGRRHHSAGVGLAFCKLAVEAHGGTIGMEPGEVRGSTFWFELPA